MWHKADVFVLGAVGQAGREAEGDTPADVGAAADGGAVSQTGPV